VALNGAQRAAAVLALITLTATGCAARNAPAAHADAVQVAGSSDAQARVEAAYIVAGSSRVRGGTLYRLGNPATHAAALELIVADTGGASYVEHIAAGTHDPGVVRDGVVVRSVGSGLAIARDGVVLCALGTAGAAEQRAFLKAMRSPKPARPLRPVATFTAALLARHEDGEDVELYLIVTDDGRSVTFAEKDPENRPLLTRFLSR